MAKQTKDLFKPEVYEAMQRRLEGPSRYRGAEEAFEMFYADRKLLDFLRAYAIREDIIEVEERTQGYRRNPRFSQAEKDRSILLIDDSKMQGHDCGEPFGVEKSGIYIGPRQNQDAALMIYTHLGEIIPQQSTGLAAGEVIKKDDVWKIKVYTYFGGSPWNYIQFDEKSFPVSQAPLFQRISKQHILDGLEKAVDRLLNRE